MEERFKFTASPPPPYPPSHLYTHLLGPTILKSRMYVIYTPALCCLFGYFIVFCASSYIKEFTQINDMFEFSKVIIDGSQWGQDMKYK